MKHNGIELQEFTSDKPVVFDPPKKMLVWDTDEPGESDIEECFVHAYIPGRTNHPVVSDDCVYGHCAEIPEEPKPRRATNRELAKWLAQGNGERRFASDAICTVVSNYRECDKDKFVNDAIVVRKWDDTEWHEPTVDYMFGEDAE